MRASPPESLTSSWHGPELAAALHQGPSVVPRDPAHQAALPDQAMPGPAHHGRRQGRVPGAASRSPQQEDFGEEGDKHSGRPDSAAYKAKVLAHSCIMFSHQSVPDL